MKLSLYEIEKSHLQIVEHLVENGGELTPELEEALALNEANLQTKGTNYGLVIKELEAQCTAIDSQIERLNGLMKSREKAIQRLKDNLKTAMQIFDIKELKTPLVTIRFGTSTSVEVDNMAQLDEKFIVEKVSTSLDKTAIKKAIQAGEEVNGARLITNQNIQIK